MLRTLAGTMRRRAGRLLALAYLYCVIATPVSLTFADAATAAHCLNEDHHIAAAMHAHDDAAVHEDMHGATHAHGVMHDHADHGAVPASGHEPSDGKRVPANCCGLFCVNATANEVGAPVVPQHPRGRILPQALAAALGGEGAARIDRPPIALMSL